MTVRAIKTAGVASGSPLARLRAGFEARQEADPDRWVDIWPGGELVAKIGRGGGIAGAVGTARTTMALARVNDADEAQQLGLSVEDLADVIAAATISLHTRDEAGEHEPIVSEHGLPLRFDEQFGAAIGVPEVVTPRGAVMVAFTGGEPPEVDALMLLMTALKVAGMLMADRQVARETVQKDFPTRTGATRP